MQIVIAGGGPAGAICARTLARLGFRAILIEASPNAQKPCAGGIPSVLLERYLIPELLIKEKCTGVIFCAPSGFKVPVDFPDGLFIATVNRLEFDNHLRWSAEDSGVKIVTGRVTGYEMKGSKIFLHYRDPEGIDRATETDFLVGADGAASRIAKITMGRALDCVVAIQEEYKFPDQSPCSLRNKCLFNYSPAVSPDYYGWIFPKGNTISIGVGTKLKNRDALSAYLDRMKEIHADILKGGIFVRRNGGLIPSERYNQYGSKRILLAGDAAGLVLPACGEGIFFAMRSGELAAEAIAKFGARSPEVLVSKYTDNVNREFMHIFKYFSKIERLTYRSAHSRETFVRLAQDRFMGEKILRAFATKTRKRTPIFKKIAVALEILAIRLKVALFISKQEGFGK